MMAEKKSSMATKKTTLRPVSVGTQPAVPASGSGFAVPEEAAASFAAIAAVLLLLVEPYLDSYNINVP